MSNNNLAGKRIPRFGNLACMEGFVSDMNPNMSKWEKYIVGTLSDSSKNEEEFLQKLQNEYPELHRNLYLFY